MLVCMCVEYMCITIYIWFSPMRWGREKRQERADFLVSSSSNFINQPLNPSSSLRFLSRLQWFLHILSTGPPDHKGHYITLKIFLRKPVRHTFSIRCIPGRGIQSEWGKKSPKGNETLQAMVWAEQAPVRACRNHRSPHRQVMAQREISIGNKEANWVLPQHPI